MPVIRAAEAVVHELHGARFRSYPSAAGENRELAAWRVEIPAGSPGAPHSVTKEEVLYVLSGSLRVTLDGETSVAGVGDVIVVPVGPVFQLATEGDSPATAWVTTSVGLEATLADGTRIAPPWAS